MTVDVEGAPPAHATTRDLILAIIHRVGTAGATGCAIEFSGSTTRALTMEGRLTLCNRRDARIRQYESEPRELKPWLFR